VGCDWVEEGLVIRDESNESRCRQGRKDKAACMRWGEAEGFVNGQAGAAEPGERPCVASASPLLQRLIENMLGDIVGSMQVEMNRRTKKVPRV